MPLPLGQVKQSIDISEINPPKITKHGTQAKGLHSCSHHIFYVYFPRRFTKWQLTSLCLQKVQGFFTTNKLHLSPLIKQSESIAIGSYNITYRLCSLASISHVSLVKPPTTPSPPPKRKSPSNKFLEALDQIERAVYEAQAAGSRYHHSSHRLAKLRANIKLATQKRNYLFARKALGHGLYTVMEMNKKSGRKRRATTSAETNFMDSIKTDLGNAAFDTFMSVNGEVTLMFAIDDTGSMGDEIQAAKDIAIAIVNKKRDEKVDYILSPFNDPGKNDDEGFCLLSTFMKSFVQQSPVLIIHLLTRLCFLLN